MLDIRHLALGFAAGVGIGVGGSYLYLEKRQPQGIPIGRAPGLTGATAGDAASRFQPAHPALAFGAPSTDSLRFFSGYVACFDGARRTPKWVLEHFTKDTLQGDGVRSRSDFVEDSGLDPRIRPSNEDYQDSGYDRGHMAPAANHRASQKAMDETFVLSNIAPQVGSGFNRDYWARFERHVRDCAKRADGVYVVSGPLWLPRPDERGKWVMEHPMIGRPPRLVSVPTHFYKVVLSDNRSGQHGPHTAAVGAFVMPNAPIDPATPLTAFAVPLGALEVVAGTRFFPGFVNDARRSALDAVAQEWQDHGRRSVKGLERKSVNDATLALQAPPGARGYSTGAGAKQAPAQAAASAEPPAPPLPRTVDGAGAVHLCEVSPKFCELPPERFWEGSGGGGGGGPKRSRSSLKAAGGA